MDGSQSKAHRSLATCWSRPPGQRSTTPGPLRAFYRRIRARRGAQIAIVAVARKLAVLSWQLLTKQEDYAFKRSTLVEKKLRAIELRAGAPDTNAAGRRAERS